MEIEVNNYLLLDKLLFKLMPNLVGIYTYLLCIPSSKIELLLHQYHTTLKGEHNGIIKTISDRLYCPNLAFHLRAYITGCHLCQLFKNAKRFSRAFQNRINLNTPSLMKICMDFKSMPKSTSNYKFILVLLCKVSNFMVVEYTKLTKPQRFVKFYLKLLLDTLDHPHMLEQIRILPLCQVCVNISSKLWNETNHS